MSSQKPLVAVLPFQNMVGHDGSNVLAQGLFEDVCGELTRFRSLQIISWISAMAVADLPDREIGERLGATHVLRSRLRWADDRLRLTASLVECAGGTQLWTEQFEAPVVDIFEVQDEVVAQIAATFATHLEKRTLIESHRKPSDSLAAYELTLHGLDLLRQGTLAADEEARGLFQRALDLDPHYARAHAGLSLSWFNEWSCQFWERFQENAQLAYVHAHRALQLDDRDALLHVVIGKVLMYRREFDRAAWYFDRALALCPNDAEMLIQMSVSETFLGRPELGAKYAERAMHLNPYPPNHYYAYAAVAHAAARNFETAVKYGGRIDQMPIVDVPAYIAIAFAHLGRIEEGRAYLATYIEEYSKHIIHGNEPKPGEACRWLLDVNPYRRREDWELLAQGFRILGEPWAVSGGEVGTTSPLPASGAKNPLDEAAFVHEGEQWLVTFERRSIRLPDLKGLWDIRRLLAQPGEEIHCLDLTNRGDDTFSGDAALDEKARAALQERIRDLQEELTEAEDMNDIGRAERAQAEMDRLVDELSRALGLGGRSRRLGDATERARTTVAWRIRYARQRIVNAHAELGRHLTNSLRTGIFCSYQPERPVAWRL